MVFFIVNIILMLTNELQIPYQNCRDAPWHVSTISLFHLFLVGLQSCDKAVFHSSGGVGGATDGIDLLVESLLDGEAVPRFIEAAFDDTLSETRRLFVVQQHHILDATVGIQGD